MDYVESKSLTKFESQVKDSAEFDLADRTCRILIPNLISELTVWIYWLIMKIRLPDKFRRMHRIKMSKNVF